MSVAAAYWLAFTVASLVNWAHPGMSFDLVPYLGLTTARNVMDDRQVHDASYRELRKIADPNEWRDLTEHNAYVHQMKADPALFSRDLGFYRIKWGYFGLARVLAVGMEPYAALRFIAVVSLMVLLGLTFYLLWWSGSAQGVLLIGPVLMAGQLKYVIGSTTPDMLALALTALLLTGWLRQSSILFIIASALGVVVRPDMLFLVGGIFAG